MRKVSREIVDAFVARRSRSIKSTSTDGQRLMLHGNVIAYFHSGGIEFTLAGWNTVTTRERLNALFDRLGLTLRVHQHKHQPYVWNYRTKKDYPISSRDTYSPREFA
jgi:hypothetical protein